MKRVHIIYISVIVLLLIVIAGGFYYFHKKSERAQMVMGGRQGMMRMTGGKAMGGMAMGSVTPPAISDQQTQQLKEGVATSTTQKIFNLTAGNFYFVPNKITVNKGDHVTLYVTNAGGIHDLVIDELGVKTPIIKTANTATFTFTASKTGSFIYYCDVPGHRAKGMWGTLVVQ